MFCFPDDFSMRHYSQNAMIHANTCGLSSLSVASRPFLHNQTLQDYHSHFSNRPTLCKSSIHPCLLTMLGCLFKGKAFAILPNINSHRTDIKIYEAVTCYVWSNEKVAFQSEGKQLSQFSYFTCWFFMRENLLRK